MRLFIVFILLSTCFLYGQENSRKLPAGNLYNSEKAVIAAYPKIKDTIDKETQAKWRSLLESKDNNPTKFQRFLENAQKATEYAEKQKRRFSVSRSALNIGYDTVSSYAAFAGPWTVATAATLKEGADYWIEIEIEKVDENLISLLENKLFELKKLNIEKYQRLREDYEDIKNIDINDSDEKERIKRLIDFSKGVLKDTELPLEHLPNEAKILANRLHVQRAARLIFDQRIDFEKFKHQTNLKLQELVHQTENAVEMMRTIESISSEITKISKHSSELNETRKNFHEFKKLVGTEFERHKQAIELLGYRSIEDRKKLQKQDRDVLKNTKFRVETQTRLLTLEEAVLNNEVSLGALGTRIGKQELKLANLQDKTDLQDGLIYQLYSSEDRAKLLKNHPTFMSNAFPEGSKKRQKEIERQEEIAQNQKIANALQQTRGYIQGGRKLARNIGLKGKDLERMDKILSYLDASVAVALAYTAPSPTTIIGAVSAISSIFSKPKTPRDYKFEAIMKEFGIIHQRLDLILENQRIIIENQERLFKAIHESYIDLSYQLQEIDEGLKIIRDITKITIELQKQKLGENIFGYQTEVFPLWSEKYQIRSHREHIRNLILQLRGANEVAFVSEYALRDLHYKKNKIGLWKAITDMRNFVNMKRGIPLNNETGLYGPKSSNTAIHPIWWIETYVATTKRKQLESFKKYGYEPLLNSILPDDSLLRTPNDARAMFLALQNPSASFDKVYLKNNWKPKSFPTDKELGHPFSPSDELVQNLLSQLIHPEMLVETSKIVLDMTFYIESTWSDGDPQLIPATDLVKALGRGKEILRDGRRLESKWMLENLLLLLDTSIAQQSLLAGDIAIRPRSHAFYRFLTGTDFTEENAREWKLLFSENRLFLRNFYVSILHEWFETNWLTVDNFVSAEKAVLKEKSGTEELKTLKKFFPGPWREKISVERQGQKAFLILNLGKVKGRDQIIVLPRADNLYNSKMKYPNELFALKKQREKVAYALQGFKLLSDEIVDKSQLKSNRDCLELMLYTRAQRIFSEANK